MPNTIPPTPFVCNNSHDPHAEEVNIDRTRAIISSAHSSFGSSDTTIPSAAQHSSDRSGDRSVMTSLTQSTFRRYVRIPLIFFFFLLLLLLRIRIRNQGSIPPARQILLQSTIALGIHIPLSSDQAQRHRQEDKRVRGSKED